MDSKENLILYIVFPKETKVLGEIEYRKKYVKDHIFHRQPYFLKRDGYGLLEKTIQTWPEKLNKIQIRGNNDKVYSIDKLFNLLEQCIV